MMISRDDQTMTIIIISVVIKSYDLDGQNSRGRDRPSTVSQFQKRTVARCPESYNRGKWLLSLGQQRRGGDKIRRFYHRFEIS